MKSIIKSTIRNFIRKPATNLINLVGLSVSLALVIILSVYSYSELTTDNFHKNGNRVYLFSTGTQNLYSPGVLKDQIDLRVPEVEATVRMALMNEIPTLQVDNREPVNADMVFADKDFFKLFTYQAAEGNLETALKEPMTIVLTKHLAEQLFGTESAVGKTIRFNNDKLLTVSAVIEPPKGNTVLSFSSLANMGTRKIVYDNGGEFKEWGWNNFQTFILLKEGSDPARTAKAIAMLYPDAQAKNKYSEELVPLKKMYFTQFHIYGNTYLTLGDKQKVMILVMVAALVLIIALVNFINISSSQWLDKIRQTGVLKVLGAGRTTILRNILSESFIIFLISLFMAIFIILLVFPFISQLTGIHFNINLLYKPLFLLVAIASTFVLSVAFSIFPALRISSSKATNNLKAGAAAAARTARSRAVRATPRC